MRSATATTSRGATSASDVARRSRRTRERENETKETPVVGACDRQAVPGAKSVGGREDRMKGNRSNEEQFQRGANLELI